MNRLLFSFLFLLSCSQGMCQNLTVTYSRINNNDEHIEAMEKKYKHVKEDIRNELIQMFNSPMIFKLKHFNGQSKFYKEEAEERNSENELNFSNHSIKVVHQKSKIDPHILKNIIDGESLELRDAFGKGYIVKDSLSFAWEIHQDRKFIAEYECIKATTYHDNLEVEAWYAEEIPIFDGPSVFYGLPGLIMEIRTEKYYFGALEITFSNNEFIFQKPSGYPTMTKKEFDIMLKKRIENMYPEGSSVTLYK